MVRQPPSKDLIRIFRCRKVQESGILDRGQRCRTKTGIEQRGKQSPARSQEWPLENVEVKRGAGNTVQNEGNAASQRILRHALERI